MLCWCRKLVCQNVAPKALGLRREPGEADKQLFLTAAELSPGEGDVKEITVGAAVFFPHSLSPRGLLSCGYTAEFGLQKGKLNAP